MLQELLAPLRALLTGPGAMFKTIIIIVGVATVGKELWIRVKPIKTLARGAGGGGAQSPLSIVAKGVLTLRKSMGPWGLQDFTLGLAAMAKVTEKQPPEPPGKALGEEVLKDGMFLMQAQRWRAHAEAVYSRAGSASWSLQSVYLIPPSSLLAAAQTNLPESAIIAADWNPCSERLRPAYVVALDAAMGAIVVAVRGTNDPVDMMLNSATHPVEFMDGYVHGGFLHASNHLVEELSPAIEEGMRASRGDTEGEAGGEPPWKARLVLVGHSMGAATAILCGLRLREKYPNLQCWGYGIPACVTLDLAAKCREFAYCFFGAHDLIPRFSLASVESLRQRVCSFDWEEAKRVSEGDPDFERICQAADAMDSFNKRSQELAAGAAHHLGNAGKAIQGVFGGGGDEEDGDGTDRPNGVEKKDAKGEEPPEANGSHGEAPAEGKANGDAHEDAKEASGNSGRDGEAETEKADHASGGRDSEAKPKTSDALGNESEEEDEFVDGIPTLHPPGRLFCLTSDPPGSGLIPDNRADAPPERQAGTNPDYQQRRKAQWFLTETTPEDIREIVVSAWCLSDHMMATVLEGLDYHQRRAPPIIQFS
eukprot:SM000058S18555  [mRNA]  locus=s58:549465:552515:- [translate_table: standard]